MPTIFLSYTRPDRERVTAIKLLLELAGATVFLDWRSIPPGAAWEPAIERALEQCDILCVFWSKATPKSDWVRREYETFLAKYPDRRCVPLSADDTPLPAALAARQAPPEILALCNELLAKRRELVRLRVSPKEIERQQRELLTTHGVNVDDRQWKKLAIGFGAGALTMVGARPLLAKIATALLAVGTTVSVVWLRCEVSGDEKTTTQPGPSKNIAAHPGAEAGIDTVHAEPTVPQPKPSAPKDCPPEPANVVLDDPNVARLDDQACAALDAILHAAPHDFATICTAKTGEVQWSTNVALGTAPCNIVGGALATASEPAQLWVLCQLPPSAGDVADRARDELTRSMTPCLLAENGWNSSRRTSTSYIWSVDVITDSAGPGLARVSVSIAAQRRR